MLGGRYNGRSREPREEATVTIQTRCDDDSDGGGGGSAAGSDSE